MGKVKLLSSAVGKSSLRSDHMVEPDCSDLAGFHQLGDDPTPAALPGTHAVGDTWRARRPEAIRAIATWLRAIHALPTGDFPKAWEAESWPGRRPESLGQAPSVDDPVIVHGDACGPNSLVSTDGEWVGHVDLGDLTVGDRWADLAIASLSLDWNFGEGHQAELFEAYGIAPDTQRISYYRELWDLES